MTRRIRRADPEDATTLQAIQRATLSDPNPSLLTLGVEGPLRTLVAVDVRDRPLGYLLALTDGARAYISELAVAPSHQRQGVGTALLERFVSECEQESFETVRLTARASDERARSFYENRGFAVVERTPAYYDDGTDGVTYERRLR